MPPRMKPRAPAQLRPHKHRRPTDLTPIDAGTSNLLRPSSPALRNSPNMTGGTLSPIKKRSPAVKHRAQLGIMLSPLASRVNASRNSLAKEEVHDSRWHFTPALVNGSPSRPINLPDIQLADKREKLEQDADEMLDRVCSVMKQLIQNRRSVETLTIESATKLQQSLSKLEEAISSQLHLLDGGRAPLAQTNPPAGSGLNENLILIKRWEAHSMHCVKSNTRALFCCWPTLRQHHLTD
jgi:hypothetical protein